MDTTGQDLRDAPPGITLQEWLDRMAPVPAPEGRTRNTEGSTSTEPCLPDDAQALSINLSLSPSLAAEIGVGLYPAVEIAERHGVSAAQLDRLLAHPPFKAMVDQAREEWGAPRSDKTRITRKSRIVVEQCLASMYRTAMDPLVSPMVRLAYIQAVAKFGGIGEPERGAADTPGRGNGFSIVINLPPLPNSPDQTTETISMTPHTSQPRVIEGKIDAET